MPEFEEGMHYQAAESLILILFFFSLIKKPEYIGMIRPNIPISYIMAYVSTQYLEFF